MADVDLSHQPIYMAHDDLVQAGGAMRSSMEECLQTVRAASQQLSGQLQDAANQLYNTLQNANEQMTQDINDAANTLAGMHQLLSQADAKGAAVMSS